MTREDLQPQSGVEIIELERRRQIEQEGYSPEDDDARDNGELARAAACYAVPPLLREFMPEGDQRPRWWPFPADNNEKGGSNWKPMPGGFAIAKRIRELGKAGALVAAEIDRLMRLRAKLQAELDDVEKVLLVPDAISGTDREKYLKRADFETRRAQLKDLLA